VPGGELLRRANVDDDYVVPTQAIKQLFAPDSVDLLAEVVACGPLDLSELGSRGIAQRQPDPERPIAGERVAHAGALALAVDQARSVEGLQVLRGVRRGLPAGAGELLDRARGLPEELKQLEPAWTRERLAHHGYRLEDSALRVSVGAHICYSIDYLIIARRPGAFVYFRQLLNDQTACASYLLGCKSHSRFAVVDPHIDLVEDYIALAEGQGIPIVAVFETHLQADHVSGLPELVARTGATPYLPEGADVEFEHRALGDDEVVQLGNTELQAIATPGHASAHHAYLVTDRTRSDEPWMVLTGDALLIGDAGRPDLHAHGEQTVEQMAGALYRSLTERLLALPDHLTIYPAHYSGSVCGRGLSANPISTVGFERRHNRALRLDSEEAFVKALTEDIPPAPEEQAKIIAANRTGRSLANVQ
jgi:hydroxyacylglutathione hydrolase